MTDDIRFFLPIAKIDKEKRTVSGYASTETKDMDGEIIALDAVKKALPGYMAWRNIREMHRLSAVGTAQEAHVDANGLFLTARIVDDKAWKKCLEGVYSGFSIGGRKLNKVGDTITDLELTEISVVDRPANPDCRITVAKSAKGNPGIEAHLLKVTKEETGSDASAKVLRKIAKVLAKAGPPAARDGFSLPAPGPNRSPKDTEVQVNKDVDGGAAQICKHGKPSDKCAKCIAKREFSAKQRQAAASSGAALPDGSFPIENQKDLENAIKLVGQAKDPKKARSHIQSRASILGLKLPDSWNSSKKISKAAFLDLAPEPSFLTLAPGASAESPSTVPEVRKSVEGSEIPERDDSKKKIKKGMRIAGRLSDSFDNIRSAQRDLIRESKSEKDSKDRGLATKLGTIAKDLAGVIGQKAEHEGNEALDMSDADDYWIQQLLGDGEIQMAEQTGDLGTALLNMVKRAAIPTRAMRMKAAGDNLKKARVARKECAASIKAAHSVLKAAYISKAAKGKKPDDDADDDPMEKAMMELNKAFTAIGKVGTFSKAAKEQIKKAAGRSGERGQEAGDAESGFYEVPPGVTDLSPAALAGAGPGSKSGGSQPPEYPGDGGRYPGKAANGVDLRKYAKNGVVPVEIAELAASNQALEARVEALSRLPADRGSPRPHSFDVRKLAGDKPGDRSRNEKLMEGVDTAALLSADEDTSRVAKATVAGNFLMPGNGFGKSITDPNFRGGAGSGPRHA